MADRIEESVNDPLSAAIRLRDTGERFTVLVEDGYAEILPGQPASPDLVIELNSRAWHELVLGLTSALSATNAGRVIVRQGERHLAEFDRRLATGAEAVEPRGVTRRDHKNGSANA